MKITIFAFTFLLAACAAAEISTDAVVGGDLITADARRMSYLRRLKKEDEQEKKGGGKKKDDKDVEEKEQKEEEVLEGEGEHAEEVLVEEEAGGYIEGWLDTLSETVNENEGDETTGNTESAVVNGVDNADNDNENIEIAADNDNENIEVAEPINETPKEGIINTGADELGMGTDVQRLDSQEKSGMKPVGKAFLSLFVIGVFAAVIFLVVRRRRRREKAQNDEAPTSSTSRDLVLVDTKDTVDSKGFVPMDDLEDPDVALEDIVAADDVEESTAIEVSNVDFEIPPTPAEQAEMEEEFKPYQLNDTVESM